MYAAIVRLPTPDDDFDLNEPKLGPEDPLVHRDEHFGSETVAVVTGAASWSGQATSIARAANGLTVGGADIDDSGLEVTVDIADDVGADGEILTVPTDLTDENDVETMVDAATERGDLRYVAPVPTSTISTETRGSDVTAA